MKKEFEEIKKSKYFKYIIAFGIIKKVILLILLFIPLVSFGQDFRKMNFGDTKDQLKETYPDVEFLIDSAEGMDLLYHEGNIAGITTQIGYIFFDNKLMSGSYIFAEKDYLRTDEERVRDYNNVSERLNEKYDMEDNTQWFNTNYKDEPGYALSRNHVIFREVYEGENVYIAHSLAKESGSVGHSVFYASKEFLTMMQRQAEEDF